MIPFEACSGQRMCAPAVRAVRTLPLVFSRRASPSRSQLSQLGMVGWPRHVSVRCHRIPACGTWRGTGFSVACLCDCGVSDGVSSVPRAADRIHPHGTVAQPPGEVEAGAREECGERGVEGGESWWGIGSSAGVQGRHHVPGKPRFVADDGSLRACSRGSPALQLRRWIEPYDDRPSGGARGAAHGTPVRAWRQSVRG